MNSSGKSSGGRTTYKDQIHVEGQFGTKTYRRDDEPEVGYGDIECVAVFTGVVDFHSDAIIGPVSLGESVADEFRSDVGGRIDDIEFRTFEEAE